MLSRRFYILASLGFLLCSSLILAQGTTGTISGVLTDETQGVLPGVTVNLKHLDTAALRTVVSDDQGRYRAPGLRLGSYELEAELPGFQRAITRGIELTIGREEIVNITMRVGEVAESVTITSEAPLVNTRQAQLGELVTKEQVDTLPLNGRNFQQLAILQPGMSVSTKARSDASRGKGTKVTAAGTRHNFSQYLLDGMELSDPRNTTPAAMSGSLLGVEAVREFKVLSSAYSAEYGRNAGAVILISTRAGTNAFHGSVYEFHRNDNLDASNFFDAPITDAQGIFLNKAKPEFKRNQFGFVVAGPIVQDKTFFLANYEGLRAREGVTRIGFVPDAAARKDTIGTKPVVVNELVKPYLALMPLPNGGLVLDESGDPTGVGRFLWTGSDRTDDDYFTARLDHTLSDNTSIFGRYTFSEGKTGGAQNLPIYESTDFSRSQNSVIEINRVFGPTWINQFRVGYNRVFRISDIEPLISIDPSLSPRPGEPLGQIRISGTSGIEGPANDPSSDLINTFDFVDNVSYSRGSHDLRFGFLGKRIRYRRLASNRLHGAYEFESLEDFVTLDELGRLRAAPFDIEPKRYVEQSLFGFYVQDNWSPRSNLTLNLGLRYEFITVPIEIRGNQGHIHNPLIDAEFHSGPDAPFFDNPSLKNFAPRLGIAWDPSGDGKTSIRTGFGIFYNQMLPAYYGPISDDVPPFGGEIDEKNVEAKKFFPVLPDSALVRAPGAGKAGFHEFDASTPYVMQYNLSIQREIFAGAVLLVAYGGSRGVHIERVRGINIKQFCLESPKCREGGDIDADAEIITGANINQFELDGVKIFEKSSSTPRLNTNFTTMDFNSTDGSSVFNSLQLGLNKRFEAGLSLQGAYTYGRAIDDLSQVSARQYIANITQPGDPFNRTGNRGLADFDVRHTFVVNGIYDLPFGAGLQGAAGKLLADWQVASIMTVASGAPLSVVMGFDHARSREKDGQRPLLVGSDNNPILSDGREPKAYFDLSASALDPPPEQQLGTPGTIGRNTIIGPGVATFDFSLLKNTSIGEQARIEFRAEFFNIFNRANFQVPGLFDDNTGAIRVFDKKLNSLPQAAEITETTATSRQIQLSLKIAF